MFNRKFSSLFLICFVFLSQSLLSQIVLQGTVTDNGAEYLGNGSEPVAGVLVTITDQSNTNHAFSSYTDEQGQYSIEIIQTSIDDETSVTPGTFRLLQNYPNPFNPCTVIGYKLSKLAHISIEIYNVLGQKVRTLDDGFKSTSGQVRWDGTDDMGLGVPAGLYIYSLEVEGKRVNRKMLLIDGHQGSMGTFAPFSYVTELIGNMVLSEKLSDQYVLTITGENIASYEQRDLEIPTSMTANITVTRTVTDGDGNVYPTVKIGDQWWTAENLKVTYYRNGDAIPNVTESAQWMDLTAGAYCYYNNNENNVATYGRLYNWYALNDSRCIAPEGWHVPTDEEWRELEMYLGMSEIEAYSTGWRGTDEGGKLKETGTAHWNSPNVGATNESGFTALPGGSRYLFNSSFNSFGKIAIFWSSTELNIDTAWYRNLSYNGALVLRAYMDKQGGNSVRLIRD